MCESCLKECCIDPGYCVSVSAKGKAFTITGDEVTATATASSCSQISYVDAWLNANEIAKQNAEITAKNDSNIIDQTLEIIDRKTNIPIFNTRLGRFSFLNNITGIDNTAIGGRSLEYNTTGLGNTATGRGSLQSNTIGDINTAVGYDALTNNTVGNSNTAVGSITLLQNTTGSFNTAIGKGSLTNNTTGDGNIALGVSAASNVTTGCYNTYIGYASGSNSEHTVGSFNTCIGSNSQLPDNTANHQIQIGTSLDKTYINNLKTSNANINILQLPTTSNLTVNISSIPAKSNNYELTIVGDTSTFLNGTLNISNLSQNAVISSLKILGIPVYGKATIFVNSEYNGNLIIILTSSINPTLYTLAESVSKSLTIAIGLNQILITRLPDNNAKINGQSYIVSVQRFRKFTDPASPLLVSGVIVSK